MGNRRIWWGLGIMVAGVFAAWPFRKAWIPAVEAKGVSAPRVALEPLVVHAAAPTRLPLESSPAQTALDIDARIPLRSALHRQLPKRDLVDGDEQARLPAMASDYAPHPHDPQADPRSAVLGVGAASPAMAPPPSGQRQYRIRKHDTLDEIAERLLGSRQHADKVMAANPEVILIPEVLPVGATIVIPDLSQPAETIVRVPDMGN